MFAARNLLPCSTAAMTYKLSRLHCGAISFALLGCLRKPLPRQQPARLDMSWTFRLQCSIVIISGIHGCRRERTADNWP